MQGFREKYRKPFRARKIFPRNPKGLTLLVRKEHELPLPVSYGDSATGWQLFPIGLFHKILTGLLPAFTEKNAIFALIKELFESMRNMVVLNNPAFSYPLPVLMRVYYKSLIVK